MPEFLDSHDCTLMSQCLFCTPNNLCLKISVGEKIYMYMACGKTEEWTLPFIFIFTKINEHQNKTLPCDFTKLSLHIREIRGSI